MSVSVKISEENYRMLCTVSGRLRERLGKPASLNDAISFLGKKGKISDLAGAWKMSEREANEFMASLKKGWGSWKPKYA